MKHFIIRLRQWLHFNNFKGNYHFIIVTLILFFLSISSSILEGVIFGVLLLSLLIYLFIKHKPLCLVSVVLVSVVGTIFGVKCLIYNNAKEDINKKLIVKEIDNQERYQKVTLSDGITKYIYYNKEGNAKMDVGDIYNIVGKVQKQSHANTPGGFDYANYLKYQNILGILEIEQAKYVKNIFTFSKINYLLERYYDSNLKQASIIKALVIGKKTGIEENLKTNIQNIGISHLFVVSGLHVGILTGVLSFFLKKLKLKPIISKSIIYFFLGSYLIITNFMVSVIRVSLAYLLKDILSKDFTPLDKISINMLIVLTINPFYLFTYGFILTYMISSMIIIISPYLSQKKSILTYIINMVIISISSIIITLPIVVNINSDINLMSVLYNVIYIPFVSYILLPLSIILSFLPFLEPFFLFLFDAFVLSINTLNKFSYLTFTFPVLSNLGYLCYYLLFFFVVYMLEKKKWYFSFLFPSFIACWYNIAYFDIYDKVVFLDIAEGDATHIKTKFNKYNIIIDTGIDTDDTIVTYLKKQGVRSIDLVIISHGDSDHNGNLEKLIKEFKVKRVIISKYDYNTYQILAKNNFSNYTAVTKGDEFNLGNVAFEIIWPYYNTKDVNNNSLVFKMNYEDIVFLFTGDIEKKAEEEIIKLEERITVDVLKIAHHASNTSTHQKWLDNVSFNVGVAMTGDKNTFGFPNRYTVERLEKYQIYYTSECDTITFSKPFFKKKWSIMIERDK